MTTGKKKYERSKMRYTGGGGAIFYEDKELKKEKRRKIQMRPRNTSNTQTMYVCQTVSSPLEDHICVDNGDTINYNRTTTCLRVWN